ncbi:pimeloyl-ACP methyl ester carboxylesterase [Paenibacillus shirakamiensis]|uniref:Pimeloyl-ACP methyl ester carboxylesterase n=1 Tax=Paenibacillus shirakamiensis TaxID=1265935 RepID=A0ABS4JE10_9BACL|nr:alpha/beta hydrolase [Paenibacillus shirakamiensis]MBP1999920.1 pimeloyl-ACP methyl ester carboxylesterase [Paenibacillus shirakamiensis]
MNTKEESPIKRKHTWFKLLAKGMGAVAVAILLFLVIVFIVNGVCNQLEQRKIETYGQLVPVDGKHMNVLIEGQGKETIVLLPGYGTAAPALDFKPLIEELSPNYKVIVIEPFGYGLSDGTEKERTTENITHEIHEALQRLNIDRYILMGHSIAGIYGLDYVNTYRSEVSAFVGIDSSVPQQEGMDTEFPIRTFKFLRASGLARLVVKLSPDPYVNTTFDEQTKKQMNMLLLKNMNNSTLLNEMEHFYTNFTSAQKETFPTTLPVLLFVGLKDTSVKDWVPLHEEQAKQSHDGKVITLDASHYIHHTKSKDMVQQLTLFMDNLKLHP